MPVFTVTAANAGTDELTATGHGLLTGDRFRLRNIGGALPAATPTLAPVTDYFAIRTGPDTLKVAISSSNANAGIAVDITGAGTGTTTIEYGLPYCIPTALASPNTQIKSVNDNGAWNALVALYGLLTAQAQAIWAAIVIAVAVTFNAVVTFAAGIVVGANQHVTVSGTGKYKHGTVTMSIGGCAAVGSTVPTVQTGGPLFTNAVNIVIPVQLRVGHHITAVRCTVVDSAGTTYQIRLEDTAGTQISGNTSAGNTTTQTLIVSPLNYTVSNLTGVSILLARTSGSGQLQVKVAEVDHDQP